MGGYRLFVRTYEGAAPGPTLRMRPGETLRIKLINHLPPDLDTTPTYMDQPHQLNTTNFHFHGGHVSPSGISDNVLRSMPPGKFVLHCHMMNHEELGMMQVVEVYQP